MKLKKNIISLLYQKKQTCLELSLESPIKEYGQMKINVNILIEKKILLQIFKKQHTHTYKYICYIFI